jgi:hypothetical protein
MMGDSALELDHGTREIVVLVRPIGRRDLVEADPLGYQRIELNNPILVQLHVPGDVVLEPRGSGVHPDERLRTPSSS